MSLISLPTELDYKIINFLGPDRLALSRLSKVSKYYRKQTEARLYEKIAPGVNIETHILLELLRTLVSRPSLALHIKSFDMTHTERQLPQPASSHNENWLFRYVPPDSRYYPPTKFAPTFNAKRISNFVPILHAIHFLGVRIDLRSLEQLIRSAWLANLRHLRVGHCPSIPSDTWNIPPLLRSMEVAIPKLETFEWWTYSQVPTFVTPFDTFTRLRKLKNLSIASHTLARRRTFSHLHACKVMYPEAVLPKSVESLTIHNIPVNFFEKLIIPFVRQYLRRAENGWSALTGLIKYVAAKFSMLKHLELTVNMERANRNLPDGIELLEFLPKTIIFIRSVTELLLKFEVRLIVLRAP